MKITRPQDPIDVPRSKKLADGWRPCKRCGTIKRIDTWCKCATAEEIAASDRIRLNSEDDPK